MKILVASDSHGLALRLIDAVRAEQPDRLIFLGDGVRDLIQVGIACPGLAITHVRGNCDNWSDGEAERCLSIEGHKLLLLHGHTRHVKQGLRKLRSLAQKLNVELVLFGHTHRPTLIQEDGVTYMNPGSIGRFGRASYGVLELGDTVECRLVAL